MLLGLYFTTELYEKQNRFLTKFAQLVYQELPQRTVINKSYTGEIEVCFSIG